MRQELFGIERLEQHAESLAAAQPVSRHAPFVRSLQRRLDDNAAVLLDAYRTSAIELESDRGVVPAAEWLLDNYHLVEEQIREIRDDLPPGYYRQLPKLAEGPFAGYPRVFGLAWAFIAHTDSNFDPDSLRRFIDAYQRVTPLSIGELWAVAITLRIVLVENLRRLAEQITAGRIARSDADQLAQQLAVEGCEHSALAADIARRAPGPLSEHFAAQLAKRLRDQDPRTTPALQWLEERLRAQQRSVDDVVQHAQQRQGASNVSIRNVITSMRLISDIDWSTLFERVSLVDARLCAASDFAAMDFPTRNLYRSAIEQLARGSSFSELEVTTVALSAAQHATRAAMQPGASAGTSASASAELARACDPGHHLIAGGRRALERQIGYRPPLALRLSRFNIRLGMGGYLGAILLLAGALLASSLQTFPMHEALWLLLFGLIPATEVATALVNRVISWNFGATILPGLELRDGVPASLRTLVAVPTLLRNEAELLAQIEGLEVHYLSGGSGDLCYALLSDGIDADTETLPGDAALLATAADAIAVLNARHGAAPGGTRFLLLHRRRSYNASEGRWIGWERKRGKLHELNRLLRGASDTHFVPVAGIAPTVPEDVRYVITLDADTRLPRDAALRLVGKMGHPLNRPQLCARRQRVISGHAILQPRITPALPIGLDGSLYQRVHSGPGGMDPYAAAVSDVYQDLFGEGSYTGKGIYDVDAFEAALTHRIPDNRLLSHDLFEGVFARAGLASDIELVEDVPARYEVVAKRQHRWTRGDWQLLPWILGLHGALPAVGRWKMVDNLRRSLLAPSLFAAILVCWLGAVDVAGTGLLLVLASIAIPAFLPAVFSLLPARSGIRLRTHVDRLLDDLGLAALRTLLMLALLADQSWRMADAILRTLVRLVITHRHLLEWTPSAQLHSAAQHTPRGLYTVMAPGLTLALVASIAALLIAPVAWPFVLPLATLWLAAPAIALWASRSPGLSPLRALDGDQTAELRRIARRTWRYFETFVTPAEHMLPPDNFQQEPQPVIAHRTSPTNIGLYLLSTVAAHDFGWTGRRESVDRIEACLATLDALPRFRGHFFNWYDTQDLRALDPAYVSSVDSGNLAGHLLVLANACEEWRCGEGEAPSAPRSGMADTLWLANEALQALPGRGGPRGRQLETVLAEISLQLQRAQAIEVLSPTLKRLADKAAVMARALQMPGESAAEDLVWWTEALARTVLAQMRDHLQAVEVPHALNRRLDALASRARTMALAMDFGFLFDAERKLLSIGYAMADNRLDPSCYDLLASEARLASLIAIAKGDVPTRHWFRLGRAATPIGSGSALISWSGSMFEYLMPSLVMRAPLGSLLEQTNRLVVQRQQRHARALGMPWGISESGYNARDLEFTYQYSNFGVPGLGLKRGLSENRVIAPYATALAAMVDPQAARLNFRHLAALGALGRHGFHEALDFTRARLPEGVPFAIVRSFMAHHQGMSIVAIANALQDGRMRARFHREPMIQASELLLQERMPRAVAIARPRAEEVKASLNASGTPATAARCIRIESGLAPVRPITHLLSNGRYVVMLTTAGSGYSRWGERAITRWREDATRDDWGSFIVLRDLLGDEVWTAGARPPGLLGESRADHEDVVFAEDHAEFTRRAGSLGTTMEVVVSTEHDGEVRRVTLANRGRRAREIELTSYAELVLAPAASDDAHPAFSKLFVQTEHLADFGALIATRRPRSADETRIWAAHFAVVEGELLAEPEHETDRARFIGRGRGFDSAAALARGGALSNTVGTVLDPVFALRHRLLVPAGQSARIAYWTVVAETREALLDLIDTHHDRSAYERARTLAWTQAQVQLRHLDVEPDEAADFQRLAAPILYADARFRAAPELIRRGLGLQSGLWPQAISGDLPIVLLRIDDVEDLALVRQLLRAHEYWRMKRLTVDLVIINERASSYVQDLQVAIETAVRRSQSRPRQGHELAQGAAYALRADLLSSETRALLLAVARVVLVARSGSIARQLLRQPETPALSLSPPAWPLRLAARRVLAAEAPLAGPALEFWNGLGGFADDGREYVTVLEGGATTPAPWLNVIAHEDFGCQLSAEGSGHVWAGNSRENQLTPWSNDPVGDAPGDALYLRDESSGELWTVTALPIRGSARHVARHGFGYSRFEHAAHGIHAELLVTVPLHDPLRLSRLRLRNDSARVRRLSITSYAEWVLGRSRGTAPFLLTEHDAETGALFASNPWRMAFQGRVAFADLGADASNWTCDRSEFLGRHGTLARPAALLGAAAWSQRCGAGLDPCAALQRIVELRPGATVDVVLMLGEASSAEAARQLVRRYRTTRVDAVVDAIREHWRARLGHVQVRTPDRAMDVLLNGWLLYQTLASRICARAAFYQASGAYGFRDQLQDGMALSLALPAQTRAHLLRAAGRQFVEGDVQHWWLPHSGQGVRTRISDDRAWLVQAVAQYVETSGDLTVLDETIAFLDGPLLGADEHDAFFEPMISEHSASLYEHCALALSGSLSARGPLGLPLIGSGDWNDGLNRVGLGGRGESVWLGWLLLDTVRRFAALADARGDARAEHWRSEARALREAIEREAWDGQWYRRATYDDGEWLGSADSGECCIDSIAQSWAVLSGAADPARARMAMASLDTRLVDPAGALAKLFTPPFEATPRDPGYIKGYPPGLRENGGQYSHAAMWAVLAWTRLGEGAQAHRLFTLLNPILHARDAAAVARYRIEPYVVAADVYSVAPHEGRGGWSWYTGSAAWMYRAGIEGLLGLRRAGATLRIAPCIPPDWPGFEATVSSDGCLWQITVDNRSGAGRGIARAELDGQPCALVGGELQLPFDGRAHRVQIRLQPLSGPLPGPPATQGPEFPPTRTNPIPLHPEVTIPVSLRPAARGAARGASIHGDKT